MIIDGLEIYCVDFDGTLCRSSWPNIGTPRYKVIRRLEKLRRTRPGFRCCLWTCRTGDQLAEAVAFCQDHGIILDTVNDILPEVRAKYCITPADHRDWKKISGDYYLDDKNLTVSDFLDEELDDAVAVQLRAG